MSTELTNVTLAANSMAREIEELKKQLAEYEPLNPQQCPKGVHADWLVDSEYAHACPWCRIDELRESLRDAADQISGLEHELGGAVARQVSAETAETSHEYGVAHGPHGNVTDPTWSRVEADRRQAYYAEMGPARLMQRAVRRSTWTEVER